MFLLKWSPFQVICSFFGGETGKGAVSQSGLDENIMGT